MARRERGKPSLVSSTVRQQLVVVVVTVLAVTAGLLWLTDRVMLAARRQALRQQLTAVQSADNAVLLLCDLSAEEHAGSVLLDAQGYWRRSGEEVIGLTGGPAARHHWQQWPRAAEVARRGSSHEIGTLPWVEEPVVWAARSLRAPDGHTEILVAWEPVAALRRALLPVYALVGGAALAIFGASTLLALRGARQMTRALNAVAESSVRLANSDYQVALAPQPTRELDLVSTSITQLARNLQHTSAALEAERDRLARLEGLQRQFVADASHELRAPLTSIRVTLESWQDGLLRADEVPAAVTYLLEETNRLARLVTALLDLSRIESGRMVLRSLPVDIREAALEAASALPERPGAAITVDIGEGGPPVIADPDALTRVLLNLLANARRHTPGDGAIHVRAEAEGAAVRVAVTDTGAGIDEAFLPYIWERFTRAEGHAGAEGCGLGLAIVRALVEAMGGTVGADSPPGQGATVWFSLPASAP
jgi:two-component system OmpR family sensor kinase